MAKLFKPIYFLNILLIILGCSSSDDKDCTKTIIVQPEYEIIGPQGTTLIPEIKQEIPCDSPEPDPVKPIIEGNVLTNFSYDVLSFEYTPDTGNNTSRIQFEIKLNNPNNFIVRGTPILTINSDNIQFSTSYSADATEACHEIQANSSCVLVYNKETPIDPNLGTPNKFELVSVKYVL
ncbi:hypothetical protein [Tamlana sp. I1]|uniref:hypothetical protein n=1 Tax=Tamlana sp. I1 TaxID=2762061 RepID=UPI00188F6DA5|nr:hypothetical protein [Tamlana sp. I1]